MSASTVSVTGFVTQLKYLNGRSLGEIERLLGFHAGRLAQGATFATLDRLPRIDDFETAGYSQVAGHHHHFPPDLDRNSIKRLAMTAWSPTGPNRLVKVLATLRHNPGMANDDQYPPGLGIPQWKIVKPIGATVVATLTRPTDLFRFV